MHASWINECFFMTIHISAYTNFDMIKTRNSNEWVLIFFGLLQNQGSALMVCGGSLERAWQTSANVDTDSLRVATKDATAALQVIHSDVTRLRGQAHSVIEETRGRAQELRVVVLFCVLMMTSSNGNIFHITGHLCGEFIGSRWLPCTKASDAVLWCFLWSASE